MRPFIAALAFDPSLRGVAKTLSFAAAGVKAGARSGWSSLHSLCRCVLAGTPAAFSWLELLQGKPLPDKQRRHFLEVQPMLDFSVLQPGLRAEQELRRAAADLHLQDTFAASVDLTGQVPINDEQFSVIRSSAVRDTFTAVFGVLIILWLALRSWKIIAAVFFSLMVGLAGTAALGLALVSAFNLISIAFFVLFVGLGVDFGVQFSVRYRTERHDHPNLYEALRWAACKVGDPLSLAAATTAAGSFAFLPTNYRGLAELGLIAGCGMLIAFLCSVTLIPAMLAFLQPPVEPAPVGFRRLAPLDGFLQRHRIAVIAGTLIVVLAGTALLPRLTFDFNPVNLQRPDSPAVATYRELQHEPETTGNDAELLAQSVGEADQKAKRLAMLPQVSQALTLKNLIPADQEQKIAALREVSQRLGPALNPPQMQAAPGDQENVGAIRAAAEDLVGAAGDASDAAAASARHVSDLLMQLAGSDAATRTRAEAAFVPPLVYDLDLLRKSLAPQHVTINTLPQDLVRDWMSFRRSALVKALPKGDPNDTNVLREFATAVLRAEPSAAGGAISLYESARTVTEAFVQAGSLAIVAITILLFIALRRVTDVLMTLIPLLLAGVATLEVAVLDNLSLNFANIIALPFAARRESRVQDLLRHGLAGRKDLAAAVDIDPRSDI